MDTKKNWHHRWTQSSARLVVVLALFLWYSICGAQTPSPTPPAMEVVFLGTGGPRAAGRAASWNLILIHGKARLLVDKARSKVSTSIQAADPEAVQFAEDKMRVVVQ
jgi:hypothetical protein